jgi:predicted Zn-dependent protease
MRLESKADEFALEQLMAIGANPVCFAWGMKKYAEYTDTENWLIAADLEKILSSRPLTKQRISTVPKFTAFQSQRSLCLINDLCGLFIKQKKSAQ